MEKNIPLSDIPVYSRQKRLNNRCLIIRSEAFVCRTLVLCGFGTRLEWRLPDIFLSVPSTACPFAVRAPQSATPEQPLHRAIYSFNVHSAFQFFPLSVVYFVRLSKYRIIAKKNILCPSPSPKRSFCIFKSYSRLKVSFILL